MGLNQSLYFMSLVGGMAGLISWALMALATSLLPFQANNRLPDLISAVLLGGLIGGLTVGFGDRWSGNRVTPQWVVSGAFIGMVAGAAAGGLQAQIAGHLAETAPILARLLAWMLTGSFIGLGLGLRWVTVNRARVGHALVGGLLGGAFGGLVFAGLGKSIPDLSQALGFVLTGVGISFGITLAPILLRDGLLQFVSSGDPRAQNKFGKTRKEWELQDGDSYIIGSQTQDMSKSMYRPQVEIFIPDAAIARRHARLYARDGRFYVARHPDAAGQAGLARFILRVRGETVTGSCELQGSDDIMIGRTALTFVAKHRRS
jgi:hypothetical protein